VVPGQPLAGIVFFATLGIARRRRGRAVNCLVEQKRRGDAADTYEALPRGELDSLQTLVFASVVVVPVCGSCIAM
jgi:hypothetical protein